MARHPATIVDVSNLEVANVLLEIARLLRLRGASPFRVGAYRRAAAFIRAAKEPLAEVFRRDGNRGLEQLPGIGTSLARKIAELLRRGESRALERLRHRHETGDLLTTLPTIGPRLASRIRGTLGVHSLEELLAAAHDGRLRRIDGLGRKRLQAIRDSLALRLDAAGSRPARVPTSNDTTVAELLDIDREYRERAAERRLPTVVPKRFNPTGAAWLPILRTTRHGRRFRAHFANTARSHELGHARDWVVIFCEEKKAFGQWTVITASRGPLCDKRIVRGREAECRQHYSQAPLVQLSLPTT